MRNITSILKEIKNNFRFLCNRTLKDIATVVTIFQSVSFIFDFEGILSDEVGTFMRCLTLLLTLTGVGIIAFIIESIWMLIQERVEVIDAENGHNVYVEYGDLFKDTGEKKYIVITANRCFDTLVDNDLISENTIHGMAVRKICADGYTPEQLNCALQKDLQERQRIQCWETLSVEEKRKGNLKRYPAGTIAEFKKTPGDNVTYLFLGLSAFNKNLHPEVTDMDFARSIQLLIEYCRQRSQRFPIYMPIIGTNSLDNKRSKQDLLKYIVEVLRFNRHLIDTNIHIVVHSGNRENISIHGL